MPSGSPRFETTLWSQVILAGKDPDSIAGRKALARLCENYWFPVYAFVRRRGESVADAQDLTQGFFEHILASGFFARADPERGRFRNFILGAVRHYVGNERTRRNSQRSGGRREKLPIDPVMAEQWLAAEASPDNDSTQAFDRSWANTLINQAVDALEGEQRAAGRHDLFLALKEFLQSPAKPGDYDAIAEHLRMTKGAVAAATHRLNLRFGELVKKNVRDTVATAEMADEELRFLFSLLQR